MSADFWVDALSVGVEEFDRAHREQLNMIGHIEALLDRGDRNAALAAVDVLERHLAAHQAEELELLVRTAYPDIGQILEVQAMTARRLNDLRDKITEAADLAEARRSATRMRMSFVDYLLKGDINFEPHLSMAACGLR